MNESLNKKISSILEQEKINIGQNDLSILNKKSYKFIISTRKNLLKNGYIINDFQELNTIWKINIILSRFVYKYSNFAENYLLAILENCLVLNKIKFIEIIRSSISKLNTDITNNEKISKKIESLKKSLKKIKNLKDLKFVEKCVVYNYIFQSKHFSIASIEPTLFSKIRTLRNKSVHSNYIIEYFLKDTEYENGKSLYKLVDDKYKQDFKKELNNLFSKYDLSIKFELLLFE